MAEAIALPVASSATEVATSNVEVTVMPPSPPSIPAVLARRPRNAAIKQGYLVKKVSWVLWEGGEE